MQANAAAEQHRPLGRGTHVKGTCARARFEVFDVEVRTRSCAGGASRARNIRDARGLPRHRCVSRTLIPKVNSDFKADVRSLSFSVELTGGGTSQPVAGGRSAGFLAAKHHHSPHQRRPCISGDHEAVDGIEPGRRSYVRCRSRTSCGCSGPWPWCRYRRIRKSSRISYCAMAAIHRFDMDRARS